ncbi:DUF4870 domain-containing protein [Plantactinospora sp. WMMB334]|uniref:DUF4870 domain-containing protein n=1 Tax=Plantactinospora sp. WMMB334 TaxID=3404119 RepID=UPI003B959EAA
MTEPPRPPGEYGGQPHDPTAPMSPGSYSTPGEGYPPPPPAPGYGASDTPPPTSGGGTYPTSGGGTYPTSGGGTYPTSGGGYQQPGGYPPGGGYPPPGGGYPPPGGQPPGAGYPGAGYPPPGNPYGNQYGGPAPAGYANNDEKTWALIAHFGGIVVGFIAPLVALLAKGNESPTVRAHAVEALNFQITWGIISIVSLIVGTCTVVLIFLPFIAWVVVLVFSIIAGMKANEGVLYRYPMTIRMVK